MSWLSKGIKKARKALHLPAITLGNVAKVAVPLATGGLGIPAVAALGAAAVKSKLRNAAIGGVKQVLKSKAEKAVVSKVKQLLPKVAAPNTNSPAVAMPGGAPISAAARARSALPRRTRRRSSGRASKLTRAPRSAAAARAAARAGSRRKAPTGGKDFKALSVSWRAAGKPGTWLAWVKSH